MTQEIFPEIEAATEALEQAHRAHRNRNRPDERGREDQKRTGPNLAQSPCSFQSATAGTKEKNGGQVAATSKQRPIQAERNANGRELRMPLTPYYDCDGIVLYHGDCREILPQLPHHTFDIVLTDPPYLVSYSGRWGNDHGIIEGDSDSSWVHPVFAEAWRLLKEDSLCLTFYGWPHADTFLGTWKQIGFRPVSLIVLIKDRWGLGQFTRAQHEHAYLLAKGHPTKPPAAISDVLEWQICLPAASPQPKTPRRDFEANFHIHFRAWTHSRSILRKRYDPCRRAKSRTMRGRHRNRREVL